MVLPRPALVLAEAHIELPVQRVLDPPVAPDQRPEPPGAQPAAQEEVPHVVARLAGPYRVADGHADLHQALPPLRIGQALRDIEHVVRPAFDPSMALLARLVTADVHPGE